jgi:hypothetical protein
MMPVVSLIKGGSSGEKTEHASALGSRGLVIAIPMASPWSSAFPATQTRAGVASGLAIIRRGAGFGVELDPQ